MEARLNEARANNGKLNVNGQIYTFTAADLEQIADLGHGTCGQVLKMRHIDTGFLLAVKVGCDFMIANTLSQQMRRTGNQDELKRVIMDLNVVQKCGDCPYIVECYGYLITEVCVLAHFTHSAPVPFC